MTHCAVCSMPILRAPQCLLGQDGCQDKRNCLHSAGGKYRPYASARSSMPFTAKPICHSLKHSHKIWLANSLNPYLHNTGRWDANRLCSASVVLTQRSANKAFRSEFIICSKALEGSVNSEIACFHQEMIDKQLIPSFSHYWLEFTIPLLQWNYETNLVIARYRVIG